MIDSEAIIECGRGWKRSSRSFGKTGTYPETAKLVVERLVVVKLVLSVVDKHFHCAYSQHLYLKSLTNMMESTQETFHDALRAATSIFNVLGSDEFLSLMERALEEDELTETRASQAVPSCLIAVQEETISQFDLFVKLNTAFARKLEEEARESLKALPPGLKHHNISTISNTLNVGSVIGMSMKEFCMLYEFVKQDLPAAFQKSPMELEESDSSPYCETRMKFFMTLYRLNTGCSFRHIEVIFGWSHNAVEKWFVIIVRLLENCLLDYHEGIMNTLGRDWVIHQASEWRKAVEEAGNLPLFGQRLCRHNDKKVMIPPTVDEKFVGSIGAVDGTFSVRCRVSSKTYETLGQDPSKDAMYSEYVKQHAWKLSVITSHSLGPYRQLILSVTTHTANTSDTAAYSFGQMPFFRDYLPLGCVILGDSAYLDDFFVLPPFATNTIAASSIHDQTSMRSFNHLHSQYRCCSEHGICFLKEWGVIRGRADVDLFHNLDTFNSVVNVCWGIHNFMSIYKS